jgi:hypothetical protein
MATQRRFVIVTPGLSHGKPGTIVTGAELYMTDEKLDEFVDAGHATELHEPAAKKR